MTRVREIFSFSRRLLRIFLVGLLASLTVKRRGAYAKTVSGDFKLNGEKSEHVLTSFAIFPAGGRLKVQVSSKKKYRNEGALKIRLYRDVEWTGFLRALTCAEKVKFAQQTLDVEFVRTESSRIYEATQNVLSFKDPDESNNRPHYWYFVVDDCSLELYYQDDAVPELHFELNVFNYIEGINEVSHLSADEHHLTTLHTVTLIVSSLVTFLLTMNIILKLSSGKATVHFAVMWVAAVAALDAGSSLFELMHLQIYKSNGIGSYWVDAISAHLEALCDAFLELLLLSIAAGWTLPSDVIPLTAPTNANSFQKLVGEFSKPVTSLRKVNAAGVLGLLVIAGHVTLAQIGRMYNDDFESYHDFDHLPGKILIFARVALCLLFLVATVQTRNKCPNTKLAVFYFKLMVLGILWFLSLPALTRACNVFVPYYLRHPAVFITSALSQCISIVLLAWLVTAHSTVYHRVSHMSTSADQSLTDELTKEVMHEEEVRTWKFGKAKVRLD